MTLQLKNIGMIKEANVKIDGLTVIAGENDTGKSTLGKALYTIVKTANTNDFSRKENLMLHYIDKVFGSHFFDINQKLQIKLRLENDIYYYKYQEKYPSNSDKVLYNWEWSGEKILEQDIIFVETPLVWNFTDFFRDISQVESQMRIELNYPSLMKYLNFTLHIKSTFDGLDIKKKMTDLMGGEFKKDEVGRYYFDKKGKKIDLLNTATGIKYFALFQVLSQNNYLNENTVLILDEPEVHLHPEWQLVMAKIIVELVGNGVKIVVNSHSPYMIEALELYAEKAQIHRNFYLAKKEDDTSTFLDVSDNLEPIYETLAEAIETLEEQSLDNFKW